MQNELKCLSQDLLTLYCKTKNAEIENLFIKIAASPSKPKISKPRVNKPLIEFIKDDAIKVQISPSRLDSAIEILDSIHGKQDIFSKNNLAARTDIGSISAGNVPPLDQKDFINILSCISQHSAYPSLFKAYIPTISKIFMIINRSKLKPKDPPISDDQASRPPSVKDCGAILESMEILASEYAGGEIVQDTPEVKKQKFDMFNNLLNKFAADLKTAYASSSHPNKMEIIGAIGNGALYQPNKFGKSIALTYDSNVVEQAGQMASTVLSRYAPDNVSSNYEYIKEKALSRMGAKPTVTTPDRSKATEEEKMILDKFDAARKANDQTAIQGLMKIPRGQEVIMKYMTPEQRRQQESQNQQWNIPPVAFANETQISQSDWILPLVMSMLTAIFNKMYLQIYNK